jgi:hypothetical protein
MMRLSKTLFPTAQGRFYSDVDFFLVDILMFVKTQPFLRAVALPILSRPASVAATGEHSTNTAYFF